jgi:hypothetical protein
LSVREQLPRRGAAEIVAPAQIQPSISITPLEPCPSVGARRRKSFQSASAPAQLICPRSTSIPIGVPSAWSAEQASDVSWRFLRFFECERGGGAYPPIGQSFSVIEFVPQFSE